MSIGTLQNLEKVEEIIDRYNGEERALISILQDIQTEYNYLPKEALLKIRDKLGIPLTRIYGVATFYNAFTLKPRGRHLILVCMGTACHLRGNNLNYEYIRMLLGLKENQKTTDDGMFSLEVSRCYGCCGLAPVVVIEKPDGSRMIIGNANMAKIKAAINKCRRMG